MEIIIIVAVAKELLTFLPKYQPEGRATELPIKNMLHYSKFSLFVS